MSERVTTQHAVITSEELQTWLAAKTGELQDEMREGMDMSERRSKAKQDLSNIRADLKNADDEAAWANVRDKLQAFINENKDTPGMEDAVAMARTMRNRIDRYLDTENGRPLRSEGATGKPGDSRVEAWEDKLQATMDRLGSMDQLAMIHIQDLNSRVSQATQLASNLMSSSNQAVSSVVQNIKA